MAGRPKLYGDYRTEKLTVRLTKDMKQDFEILARLKGKSHGILMLELISDAVEKNADLIGEFRHLIN